MKLIGQNHRFAPELRSVITTLATLNNFVSFNMPSSSCRLLCSKTNPHVKTFNIERVICVKMNLENQKHSVRAKVRFDMDRKENSEKVY